MSHITDNLVREIREQIDNLDAQVEIEREMFEKRVADWVEEKNRLSRALASLVGDIVEQPPITEDEERREEQIVEAVVEKPPAQKKPGPTPTVPAITEEEILEWFNQHPGEKAPGAQLLRDLRPTSSSSSVAIPARELMNRMVEQGKLRSEGKGPTRRLSLPKDESQIQQEKPTEPERPERVPQRERTSQTFTETDIRDFVRMHPREEYSARSLTILLGGDPNTNDRKIIGEHVNNLLEKGILKQKGIGKGRRVQYNRPTADGVTSRPKMPPPERVAAMQFESQQPSRGRAIKGTGGRLGSAKTARKEVNALLEKAHRQGATLARRGGHIIVQFQGKVVNVITTPGSRRSLLDERAKLKSIGLDV